MTPCLPAPTRRLIWLILIDCGVCGITSGGLVGHICTHSRMSRLWWQLLSALTNLLPRFPSILSLRWWSISYRNSTPTIIFRFYCASGTLDLFRKAVSSCKVGRVSASTWLVRRSLTSPSLCVQCTPRAILAGCHEPFHDSLQPSHFRIDTCRQSLRAGSNSLRRWFWLFNKAASIKVTIDLTPIFANSPWNKPCLRLELYRE